MYTIFWFRRDLRLNDNRALFLAAQEENVLPIFIFDDAILSKLNNPQDARVGFIHQSLKKLHQQLKGKLKIYHGEVLEVFKKIHTEFPIKKVFTNKDYEPYAIKRDAQVKAYVEGIGAAFKSVKDQVVFEEFEVVKKDGTPYTVFTPYKNTWLKRFEEIELPNYASEKVVHQLQDQSFDFPGLEWINFKESPIAIPDYDLSKNTIENYDKTRNFPATNATTFLGLYLRFGVVSPRSMVRKIMPLNSTLLSELVWREFFMQILFHFPHVVEQCFKRKYEAIEWENNEVYFKKWCKGETGYPIVDAGMRQLNETGYMHNRVRMVTASFLVKHLLVDWRWGEAYFAEKLLDYELASNNGNWQWAAGCGCDAAPYFRVFNPYEQHKKFDKASEYINKWVPDYNELTYPQPIVEHKAARLKAIAHYKKFL